MELNKNHNDEFKKIISEVKRDFINGKLSNKMENLIKKFNKERDNLAKLLNNDKTTKTEFEEEIKELDILECKIIAQKKNERVTNIIKEFNGKIENMEE